MKMRQADKGPGGADHHLMLKEKSDALNNMWCVKAYFFVMLMLLHPASMDFKEYVCICLLGDTLHVSGKSQLWQNPQHNASLPCVRAASIHA